MTIVLDDCREEATDGHRDRDWFLTINNPTEDDQAALLAVQPMLKYAIQCKEVGEKCGTPHYHVVLVFNNPLTFNSMKSKFPRANVQKVRSMPHAITYCKKDGDFKEYGKCPRFKALANASPLTEVAEMVRRGATKHEIAEAFPVEWIRHHRGIESLLTLRGPAVADVRWLGPYRWPFIQDWDFSWIIVGPPGINKSQFAKAHFEPGRVLVVSNVDDLKSFNPRLHDGIIFDDMDFRHYPKTAQIHLTDQDENRTIHNRFQDALIPAGTKKIFTCNEMCFDLSDGAIRRRVKVMELE